MLIDSTTGLEQAPKVCFSCSTTPSASIPPLLRQSLSYRCTPHFTVCPLCTFLLLTSTTLESNMSQIVSFAIQEPRAIDLQVCFWKAKRPVRVPSRFLRSSAQKALTPFQDAWQSTPEPSPLLPSTAQIP